jgi:hypothetical protein
MNYTVHWTRRAEQQLAHLWNTAPDRHAVAAAADYLDGELQRDPLSVGESRGGARRIAFVPPLTAFFDVYPPDLRVIVRSIWRIH